MAAAKVLCGVRGFSSRLLGSSTAHKGLWRNPALSEGVTVKAPERMEQLCSKRFFHMDPKRERVARDPRDMMCLIATGLVVVSSLPIFYLSAKGCF